MGTLVVEKSALYFRFLPENGGGGEDSPLFNSIKAKVVDLMCFTSGQMRCEAARAQSSLVILNLKIYINYLCFCYRLLNPYRAISIGRTLKKMPMPHYSLME